MERLMDKAQMTDRLVRGSDLRSADQATVRFTTTEQIAQVITSDLSQRPFGSPADPNSQTRVVETNTTGFCAPIQTR